MAEAQGQAIPTKEIAKQNLAAAKEAVGNLKVKVETQEDVKHLADSDIEDIKDTIEGLEDKISKAEEQLASLPDSGDAGEEMAALQNITGFLLPNIIPRVQGVMEEFFKAPGGATAEAPKPETAASQKVEKQPVTKESLEKSGSILDPELLNKIAQLEAISQTTLEFDQARYDDYMNGQPKLGSHSVAENHRWI